MSEIFHALSPRSRRAFQERYLAHLKRRDGTPDQRRHTFDVRERFFTELEARPVRWQGSPPVDPRTFTRNLSDRLEPGLDDATLWALCVAKVNRSERYGVEYAFARHGYQADGEEDPYTYIEIEETYHTRILRDAVETLGLTMEMRPPNLVTRVLIKGMVHLPRALSNVLVLSAEIAGVTTFQLLLEEARALFSAQSAPLARIEELLRQLLVDELGHVYFLRSTLDQARLSMARGLLPVVARSFLSDLPEMCRLFGRERLLREMLRADMSGVLSQHPEAAHFAAVGAQTTQPSASAPT